MQTDELKADSSGSLQGAGQSAESPLQQTSIARQNSAEMAAESCEGASQRLQRAYNCDYKARAYAAASSLTNVCHCSMQASGVAVESESLKHGFWHSTCSLKFSMSDCCCAVQEAGIDAESEPHKALVKERNSLARQLRGVTERSTLAASRLQVEDAASSLTALEQLYQQEQAKAVQVPTRPALL